MEFRFLPLRLAALATTAALFVIGCGASEVASIGFGTGGIDCNLDSAGSTFPAGATVRMVASISPLPSSVTVSATKDGDPMQEPESVALDGSVPCVYGSFPALEAGHYQFVVTIPGSQMPPLTGDFDVTP